MKMLLYITVFNLILLMGTIVLHQLEQTGPMDNGTAVHMAISS